MALTKAQVREILSAAGVTSENMSDAVDKIIGGSEIKLEDFSLQIVDAIDTGADAQGESHVRITRDGRTWNGSGVSTDIVESVIKAYLSAVNTMTFELEQEKTRSAV